jgi:hypothetical protein
MDVERDVPHRDERAEALRELLGVNDDRATRGRGVATHVDRWRAHRAPPFARSIEGRHGLLITLAQDVWKTSPIDV